MTWTMAPRSLDAAGFDVAGFDAAQRKRRGSQVHQLPVIAQVNDKLCSVEYRGTVPETSLLVLGRGGGSSKLASIKIDICGKEVSSEKELARFGKFLQLVAASTKHLHMQSARLGCGVDQDALARSLPAFRRLLHLELTGRPPHGNGDAAVSRILLHAPNLEVLSLFLDTDPNDEGLHARRSWDDCKERELVGTHQLRYNKYEVLPATPAAIIIPSCLRKRVREINFVHYHGGRAQRTLAKFLLCNALVLETLYCGFVRGTSSIQGMLRDEIQG